MTKEQVKAVLDRVLTWPPQRQEDVVQLITLMEEQNDTSYQLSDEELEEVRRRRAERNPKTLTLEEWDERLRRFGV